jgi:hypothetical protein
MFYFRNISTEIAEGPALAAIMFEADGFGSQAKLLSEKHQLFRTFLARQRLRNYPSARSKQLPQWTSPTGRSNTPRSLWVGMGSIPESALSSLRCE